MAFANYNTEKKNFIINAFYIYEYMLNFMRRQFIMNVKTYSKDQLLAWYETMYK